MGKEDDSMIGIISAMQIELDILIEELNCQKDEKYCGIDFYTTQLNGNELVLAVSGVGKVNAAIATTIMINTYGCNLIINTGIAGGLARVNTKDIIVANKLKYHDFDATCFNYEFGQVPGMPSYFAPSLDNLLAIKLILNKLNLKYKEATLYSGDRFVSSFKDLKKIYNNECSIVEMEGAAVAQVCVKSGVDFLVIRYVSDIVGLPNQIKDYLEFEKEMAERSSRICLEILENLDNN